VNNPNNIDLRNAALLSMEMQRGVVGDLSKFAPLVEVIQKRNVIPNIAKLMDAARAAGATVVHCNAEFRPDFKGSAFNTPQLQGYAKLPGHMVTGTPVADTVPEFGPKPEDVVMHRFHGMSPFWGTPLDMTLRNLKVDTVVAVGVSLNRGVFGLCIEAVNAGYRVILARDCVAGFPEAYGDMVIENSLANLCTLSDSIELSALWRAQAKAA